MAEVDSRSAEERAVEAKESGNALMKRGQLQESVHAYSASLLLLPQYLPALNNRAQAHLLLRDFRAAEADCCSVLLLEPRNLKALFRRAAARKELGHSAACLADLLAVLSADPAN
ncbi:import receptor subunit TOM34, partial [Ochromonadaceae sp. CCMP2298]